MKEKIFNTMSDLIYEARWAGACYASVAIVHSLLKFQKIDSTLCIGVVSCENGEVFDHAWLEIDELIYDLAIPFPQDPRSTVFNYFDDRFGVRGVKKPTSFSYGIDRNLDEKALAVANDYNFIMEQSPFFNPDLTYWELASGLSSHLGYSVNVDELKEVTKESLWIIKRATTPACHSLTKAAT